MRDFSELQQDPSPPRRDSLLWRTVDVFLPEALPPVALALPPLPPWASPLSADVSPPLELTEPEPTAMLLPSSTWVFPVEAFPPLPPVALASPPLTVLVWPGLGCFNLAAPSLYCIAGAPELLLWPLLWVGAGLVFA
ncbi:MAG: hypothetical protein JOZ05_02445 [Acetobacteraceae bacterium]|nr:hypothetical protein [Acetobacteraceae bacterium]